MKNKIVNLKNAIIGNTYYFKVSRRKKRIKAVLLEKDAVFTDLSIYHGSESIQFKRKGVIYTAPKSEVEIHYI